MTLRSVSSSALSLMLWMQDGLTNECGLGLQDNPLYSQDGRAYLLVQSDGNLVLYSSQVANLFGRSFASAIYATKTYGATPGPFSLVMQLVRPP